MSSPDESRIPTQYECTEQLVQTTPADGLIVSNLGVSSWILSKVEDRDRNYYMKGAMGSTTPMGLGMALGTNAPVTVIDGDGSMLMSLGALATVARESPENLTIVVMDNSEFKTTGGQPTLAADASFHDVARSCGLRSHSVSSRDEFETAYESAIDSTETVLISCAVTSSVPEEYPRPDYSHSYLKHRFRSAIVEGE